MTINAIDLVMFRAIFLQVVITIISAVVAGLFVGKQGAVSALLGGGVCVLPNLLFALRLKFVASRPGMSYPANFFLGEFIKIVLIIGLLCLVVREYANLHWPSLLIGMGLALQVVLLALWKKT